jgi:hypothetical protein
MSNLSVAEKNRLEQCGEFLLRVINDSQAGNVVLNLHRQHVLYLRRSAIERRLTGRITRRITRSELEQNSRQHDLAYLSEIELAANMWLDLTSQSSPEVEVNDAKLYISRSKAMKLAGKTHHTEFKRFLEKYPDIHVNKNGHVHVVDLMERLDRLEKERLRALDEAAEVVRQSNQSKKTIRHEKPRKPKFPILTTD